jgi:Do/DeqQ family serine protease
VTDIFVILNEQLNFTVMNTKKIIYTITVAIFSAMVGVFAYSLIFKPESQVVTIPKSEVPATFASYTAQQQGVVDLTGAAAHSVSAVVHVMVKSHQTTYYNNPLFDYFFGEGGAVQSQPVTGSGSGVIITKDGYIVTNNHVIDGAEEIEVIMNDKRSFSARIIGADPSTDVALLKIDADDLQYLEWGDSDDLKIGEWVLAVGNPFNLTSTVTAGIVSAKARSINILANQSKPTGIEAFIQTDAAVNPGNSGGALVNQKGELVGINTAIASRTGSYTGYSFAVPVNIAKKVVADLMEYGVVQRGFMGVRIRGVDKEVADKFGLDKIEGVFVDESMKSGAAYDAGIRSGDVILSIDGEVVNSAPELTEQVGKHRPGDEINILVKKNGKKKQITVTLRNERGTTAVVKSDELPQLLGAELEEVPASVRQKLGIRAGVQITKLYDGALKAGGVREGYIITKANRVPVSSVDDLRRVLTMVDEGLFLTGIYPNGRVVYYGINIVE